MTLKAVDVHKGVLKVINKCAICHNDLISKSKTRLVDDILICQNCTQAISNDLNIKKNEISSLAFLYLKNKYKEMIQIYLCVI